MRFKTLKTTALLTLSVLAAIACKKDDETTALPAVDGSVSIIGLEEFMDAASEKTRTLKLKPTGASHPEGGELGVSRPYVSTFLLDYSLLDYF